MNIGICIDNIFKQSAGGGSTFQQAIIEELKNLNTNYKFFVFYSSNNIVFTDLDKIKYVNLEKEKNIIKKHKFLFFSKKKTINLSFDEILQKYKIEILYSAMPFFPFQKKVPYILTVWDIAQKVHTYFPEVSFMDWNLELRDAHYNKFIGHASFVVTGTNVAKQQISKFYNMDEDRIVVNPMPTPDYVYSIDADNTVLDKNSLEKGKYLFYPAQLWSHKNHIRLIKAMKGLKKQGFKLVFTGSDKGNLEYLKEKVKEYNLEQDVLFLGFVSQNEIVSLYKNAFAMVYASFMGPDNIPPLEAMALNCPVICSDYDGAKEQLGDSALFFDRLDENSIIEQVEKLKDENLKRTLIEKGYKLAKERHISNYMKNIIKLIDKFAKIRECWGMKYYGEGGCK